MAKWLTPEKLPILKYKLGYGRYEEVTIRRGLAIWNSEIQEWYAYTDDTLLDEEEEEVREVYIIE